MKRLIILRHAKSSWDNADVSDYDRKLNKRGEKSADLMGEFLAAKQGNVDLILSSSAVRAFSTARIVAQMLNYNIEEIETTKKLYLAWVNDILKTIYSISNNADSCILVGHNPGLTDLVNHFGVRLDNLPTASVVCFEFEAQSWEDISRENADLKWFQMARDL